MAKKILFVTVGGSHQPIVTAIKSLDVDRTIFICSSGSRGSQTQILGAGKPCEVRRGIEVIEQLPNIPTQLNLGENFNAETDVILIDEPDNLSECYQKITEKIKAIQEENCNSELLADYTGGTKTMSVALAMSALDYRLTVYVTTTATRTNLIKVDRGETSRRAKVSDMSVQRLIEQIIPRFLKDYNYPAIITELNNLLQEKELNNPQIEAILNISKGFDFWDRFDHAEAWFFLKNSLKNPSLKPTILFLKKVMSSRAMLSPAVDDHFTASEIMKGHGYEVVEDMLLNAQRRAFVKRYDDAVARLYRCLELLEQVRLWEAYQLKTGDLEISKLPESLQAKYVAMRNDRGVIQLGLRNAYDLLSELPDDPLGKLFLQHKDRIVDHLKIRNSSILAHGLRPVSQEDYENKFSQVVIPFIEQGLSQILSQQSSFSSFQFPTEIEKFKLE